MHDPNSSGQSISLWMATNGVPEMTGLNRDVRADVCIVGAGIAGLSVAYLVALQGKSVVVLDDGPIGAGQTQRTTAHLASAIDDRFIEIERWHGPDGARLAAESHAAAIDRIETIVRDEHIPCDFERVDGYLFQPPGASFDFLDREMAAAHRAGLADVTRVDRTPWSDFDTGPCLRFPRQGQFHPLRYLSGLARAIMRHRGQIYTGTRANSVTGGQPVRVETAEGHVVTAEAVVVATNTPVNDRFATHTKQAPYITYALGIAVPRGSVAKALYWDTLDPYHYVRLQSASLQPNGNGEPIAVANDMLIVGGEDHKTGQAHDQAQRYERLESWARERFPMLLDVRYQWSGQVMETIDGLAFIGRNPMDEANVFIATGDSGMGMTHGTIAGMLITDLILGRENPWTNLYSPSRKSIKAAGAFVRENLNVAMQLGAWFTTGDVRTTDEIPTASGAVVRRGLTKIAVYRDELGDLHECSAVCPHLGCIVDWNDAEKTWDCPCHGSRFDRDGKMLNGPAHRDLTPTHKLQHAGV